MLEKLKEINRKSSVGKSLNILILLLILHLIFIFTVYYSTKFNYNNPLIPKYLVFEVFAPFAEKGLIIAIGLLVIIPLKNFKQNLIAIVICLIVIALYYFTSFEPNFAEYQK
jgi:cell division protein FtsW (lipid II flippase)